MRRREFLQALAAASVAGLPLDASRARRATPTAGASTTALEPFGNVAPAAHHRLPRAAAADALSRAERQPRRRRRARQAAAPRRRGAAAAVRHRARHARRARVHLSRLRARGARVRRDGRLRASRDADQAAARRAPRCAAARRRRHVAGLGDVAVDARPGHGRRGEAARRRRDDRALGIHVRRRARASEVVDQRLRRPYRLRRAERAHRGLRRSGVRAVRDQRINGVARRASSARRFRTRRSPIRATSFPSGRSASRKRGCRRASTTRAPRARRSSCCCRTTAWTSISSSRRACTGIDAILGGHTHDGVPQPTLVANARGKTLVTNAGSNGKFLGVLDFDVEAGRRRRLSAIGWCRCSRTCLPPDPRDGRADRGGSRAVRGEARRDARRRPRQLLYRRGNFNGTFDQLMLDALMAEKDARDRVLARLPLGHDAAAGRGDPLRGPDGPDGDHVSVRDRERADRRDDQDDPRGRRRQPVQSRSVLSAGRRHGARRRHALRDRPGAPRGRAHHADGARAASRSSRTSSTRSPAGRRCPRRRRPRAASRSGMSSRATCARKKTITPRAPNLPRSTAWVAIPGLA